MITVGDDAVVGILDMNRIAHGMAMGGDGICRSALEAGIDIDWKECELNRGPFPQGVKKPEKRPTVLASGNSDGDTVPLADHPVSVQGLAHFSVEQFVGTVVQCGNFGNSISLQALKLFRPILFNYLAGGHFAQRHYDILILG